MIYGSGTSQGGVAAFEKALVAELVDLKAFALSLSGRMTTAEDLVQTTMLKALANRANFTPGTNMRAWLITILRNTYYSDYRKHGRMQPWHEMFDNHLSVSTGIGHDQQFDALELKEVLLYLASLSPEHSDILIAIGYLGMSYERAAAIFNCAEGTIKSRLNRARAALLSLLEDGVIVSANLAKLKTATQGVPHDHPYFPIAQAYEELYGQIDDIAEASEDDHQKKPAPLKTPVSDTERLWNDLVATGALDGENEDFMSLLRDGSDE